jgi:hypothetical protein
VSSSPWRRCYGLPLAELRAPSAPPRCPCSPGGRDRPEAPPNAVVFAVSPPSSARDFVEFGGSGHPPAKSTTPSRSGRRCAPWTSPFSFLPIFEPSPCADAARRRYRRRRPSGDSPTTPPLPLGPRRRGAAEGPILVSWNPLHRPRAPCLHTGGHRRILERARHPASTKVCHFGKPCHPPGPTRQRLRLDSPRRNPLDPDLSSFCAKPPAMIASSTRCPCRGWFPENPLHLLQNNPQSSPGPVFIFGSLTHKINPFIILK